MTIQKKAMALPNSCTSNTLKKSFARVHPYSTAKAYHEAEIFEYSPEIITAIAIHAKLGTYGISRFGTFANHIYLDRSKREKFENVQTSGRIIYGQDLLLRILDIAPQNIHCYDSYGTFVAFEHAFKGYDNASEEYKVFIENYSKKYGSAYRDAELRHIKKKGFPRYKEYFTKLFDVLKSEHKDLYENLNSNMRYFGILK